MRGPMRPRRLGKGVPEKSATFREDWAVAWRFFKTANSMNHRFMPLQIVAAIVYALRPFPGIIMPKFIIDELMGAQRPEMFVLYVSILLVGTALLDQLRRFFESRVIIANTAMVYAFEERLGRRNLNMKFEAMEDPEILDLKQKALVPIEENNAIERMMNSSVSLLQNTLTLGGLFSILFTLDWVLIAALLVLVGINTLLYRRQQKLQVAFEQEMAVMGRQWDYYRTLSTDFSMGKDMRLYNMAPFLMKKIKRYHADLTGMFTNVNKKYARVNVPSGVVYALQTGIIYAYMVYKVIAAGLSIGSFSMYISAATQFTTTIAAFFNGIVQFRTFCRYLSAYMDYEELPLSQDTEGHQSVPDGQDLTIEFRHVWFRYPRSDKDVLKDVSLTIRPGEKLSVVGRNGAGKTTFIKLLCRLYAPTAGEILLGGTDIRTISHDEYMKLLAVVFQDYTLFAFPVRENIAFEQADTASDEEICNALRQAGVLSAVEALDKGLDTPIYKTFDPDGVELSGGQSQKLAIARAIYKRAPIVVLDEPTAALDPFAEAEIYTRFNELVQSHTAIYISHRLSSCRFCDHIAVFADGALAEYGTHEELVNAGGPYSELFQAQAQYYQETPSDNG